jgi:hypothetical protein
LRGFGRRLGRDLARVVGAIGQEDYHAAFRLRILEHVRRIRQAQPDGRAVFQLQIGRELDLPEQAVQHGVIGGHGRLAEGFVREHHQPNAVIRAAADEIVDDALGRFQAVLRLKIERGHAAGNVLRDDDVHAFAAHDLFGLRQLRPRQSDNQQGEREQAAHRQQRAQGRAPGALVAQQAHTGKAQARRLVPRLTALHQIGQQRITNSSQ